MADVLVASDLAVSGDFLPAGAATIEGVQFLIGEHDVEGDMGPVAMRHDVRSIKARVTDLEPLGRDPTRDDQISIGSLTYHVQSPPYQDERGLFWMFDCYRVRP